MFKLNLCELSMRTARDLGLRGVSEYRIPSYVYQKITEEAAEIHDEIILNKKGETPGKDGISGEVIDTLISVVDMAFLIENDYEKATTSLKFLGSDLTFSLDSVSIEGKDVYKELDNCMSDLISLQSPLSVATQMLNGTSYKKPERFGYATEVDYMFSILSKMTEICINMFKYAHIIESTDMEVKGKMEEIWLFKMNKWRVSRGLTEL